MLDVLAQLEQALPAMLMDESIWRSLYVDYHPPTVERLWTPWREYRAFLQTGKPWDRASHKSSKPLQPLRDEQAAELLRLFRARYPSVSK
jgi:hypothetical protein